MTIRKLNYNGQSRVRHDMKVGNARMEGAKLNFRMD